MAHHVHGMRMQLTVGLSYGIYDMALRAESQAGFFLLYQGLMQLSSACRVEWCFATLCLSLMHTLAPSCLQQTSKQPASQFCVVESLSVLLPLHSLPLFECALVCVCVSVSVSVSPPATRMWWRSSWRPRAAAVPPWVVRRSRSECGSGELSMAASSPTSSGGWAPAVTGAGSASRSTRGSARQWQRRLCAWLTKVGCIDRRTLLLWCALCLA